MIMPFFIERMNPMEAVQWTGKNFAEIEKLVGPTVARYETGTLQLATYGMGWITVEVGWWVMVESTGVVNIETDDDFEMLYMPCPAPAVEGGQ